MKNALQTQKNRTQTDLYIVFEFTATKWRLIFNNGSQQRTTSIEIGDWMGLKAEIEIAKLRMNCTKDCQIYSCYEAKRQGYWFHRALLAEGINNFALGPNIKEVNRKKLASMETTDVELILEELLRRVSGNNF